MKKKIVIGAVVPMVAALGLYFGIGAAAAADSTTQKSSVQSVVSTGSDAPDGTESEQPDGNESEASEGTESESAGESEGAADAAAQHDACLTAGIDDTVTQNVQYDDQTGACSLDAGGNDGGENE